MDVEAACEVALPELSPSARHPRVSFEQLPLQKLFHKERTAPNSTCFVQPFDGGQLRTYTWGEVLDEVRRIAAWLTAQAWPSGSRIAILGKNSAGWIMADWAIWMSGHVCVPIYPSLVATSVEQILKHCGAVACFVGKLDELSMIDGIPGDVTVIALPLSAAMVRQRSTFQWESLLAQTLPVAGEPVRLGRELATIIYTSGTTGVSKGAMFNFDMLGTVALTQLLPQVEAADNEVRAISYLPLAHVVERTLFSIGLPYYPQVTLYFAESLATFTDDIRRARPTHFVSVPRLWLKFQQGVFEKIPPDRLDLLLKIPILSTIVRRKVLRQLGLDAVRKSYSGTATIPVELLRWWDRMGLPIIEVFGMTELAFTSHSCAIGGIVWGTVGRPVEQVDHRIDHETGELQVLSPVATLGYYRAPDLTRQLFTQDGWLRTGDKGEIDAQGRLRIVGRLKDNFKTSKGKYVSPGPIESRLASHPLVDACLVLGANLPQPVGLVVVSAQALAGPSPNYRSVEATLEQHLAEINRQLDPYERLDCLALTTEAWTVANEMLTPTMKVRRSAIEKRYADLVGAWAKCGKKTLWAEPRLTS